MEIRKIINRIFSRKSKLNGEVPFYTNNFTELHKYDIGEYTYGKPLVYSWDDKTNLKIGKFCSIAENVKIYLGGNHRADWITTYPFNIFFESAKDNKGHPSSKGDVIIGNDVWIGNDATILSGVTIGDGAVIGACSVVAKNVAPYAIVAGNPARVIRLRFSEEEISYLLQLKWWDWHIDKILLNSYKLQNNFSKIN